MLTWVSKIIETDVIGIKSFVVGILVAAITAISLVLLYDWNMALKITGGIGAISLLLAAMLSGSLVSGDRMRANLNTENEEDKRGRDRATGQLLLFGIPHLCIAIVLFFVLKI